MKSLFKVTLLATTMAVALNAPLAMAADALRLSQQQHRSRLLKMPPSKMTTSSLHTRWVHL